jgi:hypothetical protein
MPNNLKTLILDDEALQTRLYDMFLTELEHDRLENARELYSLLKDKTKPDKELKRHLKNSLLALIDDLEMDQVFGKVGSLAETHPDTLRYQQLHRILKKY